MGPKMIGERLERGVGVLTGRDAHRDACLRRRHELVRGFGEPRRVDPEYRDRRLHPHAIRDTALADELRRGPEPDLLAQLRLLEVERVRLPARDPRDRDVAAIVVERRERLREHRERVGDRPAEFAGVHGVVERAHLDVAGHDPAERDRESRLPRAPVARVGKDHGIGTQLAAVFVQELAEVRRAPFLLAFDEDGHTDRWLRVVSAQRASVHHHAALVI